MTDNAFEIIGPNRTSNVVITVDHASNVVPCWINGGKLGITDKDMNRHIAYDIGTRGVAIALGKALDAPVVCSRFSRLVIDPNRGLNDPTLVMRLYDGTLISANKNISKQDIQRRIDELYTPYHNAIKKVCDNRENCVIISIHSFTPQLLGRSPRPWHVGVLSAHDRRLSDALISQLKKCSDICVGDNEPYDGALPDDSIDKHALRHGRLNTLIELRNDLIQTEHEQTLWAQRLAPLCKIAVESVNGQTNTN